MMKVVWFTNVPLEPLVQSWGGAAGGSGFWMYALVKPLLGLGKIGELHIVWAGHCKGKAAEQVIGGVHYHCIHMNRMGDVYGICRKSIERKSLADFSDLIKRVQPDVIHVHGSERHYAGIKSHQRIEVPTVLSIQGLMTPYAEYAFGDHSLFSLLPYQRLWDALRGFPTLRTRMKYKVRSREEALFLQSVDGVIGRTHWDKAHASAMAPTTRYYHVGEMLRPEFFQREWALERTNPLQLYTTARLTLLKGMHTLLEAVALVKRVFPNVVLRVGASNPPSAETRLMQKKITQLGLRKNVQFLGWLNPDQIVKELETSSVFVCPSFIENSSNAVCEAMLVGVPILATDVGGMGTLIKQYEEGILVRAGDSAVMASKIVELFENPELAKQLGKAARLTARERHDPSMVVADLMNCYEAVCR